MAEPRIYPKEAVIVTGKATLHITIEPFTNHYTNAVEHYSIHIGSRESNCIHITVPVSFRVASTCL
jgi:hypothetical protein